MGKPCQHALAMLTAQQDRDVNLEDYVHEYFSVERFQNAYKRLIEPMPDKSHWPHVDLPFVVAAPLVPRGVGRQRKLRIKSFLEGGGGKSSGKSAAQGDNNEAEKGKKQMIRGKRKCSRCGELGHGETSYKCSLNGTKKRKRKPRKNTTKNPTTKGTKKTTRNRKENAEGSTPSVLTKETIMENSPGRVTRSRLAMLLGEGTSAQPTMEASPSRNMQIIAPATNRTSPRKLTPKKLKIN